MAWFLGIGGAVLVGLTIVWVRDVMQGESARARPPDHTTFTDSDPGSYSDSDP